MVKCFAIFLLHSLLHNNLHEYATIFYTATHFCQIFSSNFYALMFFYLYKNVPLKNVSSYKSHKILVDNFHAEAQHILQLTIFH